MRILVIADIESKALWDYFDKSMLENVDLIVSCGDLNPKYLSFLATFTKAPVIYVRGNHDANYEMAVSALKTIFLSFMVYVCLVLGDQCATKREVTCSRKMR